MKSSLQSKIAFAMWTVTALSTLVAAVASGALLIRSHRESIREQLQVSVASLVSLGISDFSELSDFDQLDDFIENALQMEKVDKIIRVYNEKGALVFSSVRSEIDQFPDHLLSFLMKNNLARCIMN